MVSFPVYFVYRLSSRVTFWNCPRTNVCRSDKTFCSYTNGSGYKTNFEKIFFANIFNTKKRIFLFFSILTMLTSRLNVAQCKTFPFKQTCLHIKFILSIKCGLCTWIRQKVCLRSSHYFFCLTEQCIIIKFDMFSKMLTSFVLTRHLSVSFKKQVDTGKNWQRNKFTLVDRLSVLSWTQKTH